MILSNEPGYYEKGKFGLRIENLVYTKKYKKRKIRNTKKLYIKEKNHNERRRRKIRKINLKRWINE